MRRCKVTDFPTESTNEIISRHLASNLHIGMSRDLTTAYYCNGTQPIDCFVFISIYMVTCIDKLLDKQKKLNFFEVNH